MQTLIYSSQQAWEGHLSVPNFPRGKLRLREVVGLVQHPGASGVRAELRPVPPSKECPLPALPPVSDTRRHIHSGSAISGGLTPGGCGILEEARVPPKLSPPYTDAVPGLAL